MDMPQEPEEQTQKQAEDQTLAYWLNMFPEAREMLTNLQSKDKEQTMLIAAQKAKISRQNVEIAKLKNELKENQQNQQKLQDTLTTEQNKITKTSLTGEEVWQLWHKFIDKKITGYFDPSQRTNKEHFYIGYLSQPELIIEFKQKEKARFAAKKQDCRQFDDLKKLTLLLKNTGFGKI